MPEVFLRACRRQAVDRTPIWIMRQAGRYLPEYRALRQKYDFLTACRTPELACELTLQPVRRLDVDAAILFSDILIPLPGMGVRVDFDPGPRLERTVRSAADIEELRVPDARATAPFVMEAVRLLRRELRVPLIGFAGAPFTVATYLLEGGGSKSFSKIKGLLFSDPRSAHALLDKCAATVASHLAEQVRAGAQAAMLFDTWAGILGPEDFRTFALPYARRVFEAVARAGAGSPDGTPPRLYYAGEAAGILGALREVGAEVIGLDWRIHLGEARRRLGPQFAVQGNLDPAVLLGPPAFIRRHAEGVLRAALALERGEPGSSGHDVVGGGAERPGVAIGHVFNLGRGILPATPPEHAQALVDAVRELSSVPALAGRER